MNRTRTRALLAAAALGVATIALPITSAAATPNQQTCNHAHPDLDKIEGNSGSFSDAAAHGTITWTGATLTYDLNPGWTLDICLKSATNVERTNGLTGAGTVSVSNGQNISHIAYGLDFEAPSTDDGDTDGDDDGTTDDGTTDDGIDDDGIDDDGTTDDGTSDDGTSDDGTTDDGVSNDDDGTDDGVSNDDDGTEDDGTEDDGTDDGGTEDDGTDEDGTDEDGTDEDGTDEDGTDDDGVDVLPGGEVAPVDGGDTDGDAAGDDGDAAGDDGTETAEVPVEVLPATLDSRLPNTGSDVPALVAAAALALGLGGSALVRTRRRTTSA